MKYLMNNILDAKNKDFENKLNNYLESRKKNSFSKINLVRKILRDIRRNRDISLIKYEKKFSGTKKVNKRSLQFSNQEIKNILKGLSKKTKKDIDLAYNRILNFHKNQKFKKFKIKDKFNNRLEYRSRPIQKVGVYVPSGKASYPSSVLMNCIPAIVAGVPEIYMTVPSLSKRINPAILYAAQKCKVKKIYKIGGAQAIAAFAYGTKIIEKVDKIIGPGNEIRQDIY